MLSTPEPHEEASALRGPTVRDCDAVFHPDPAVPADGRLLLVAAGGAVAPVDAAAALGLHGPEDKVRLAAVDGGRVTIDERLVVAVPLAAALPGLRRLPTSVAEAWRTPISDALRTWAIATRVADRLLAAHRLVPDLRRAPDGRVVGVWRGLVRGDGEAAAALGRLAELMPPAAHALPDDGHIVDAQTLLERFIDAVVDHSVRAAAPPPATRRPRARLLPWTARWAEALADAADPQVPLRDSADELVAGVAAWHRSDDDAEGLVELELTPPADGEALWQLALAVRTPEGTRVPAGEVWAAAASTGGAAQRRLEGPLLWGLGRAARLFPPLERALRDAAPVGMELDLAEAAELVCRSAGLLREAGLGVELPPGLDDDALRVVLAVDDDPDTEGEASYGVQLALGDELLDDEDLDELLDADSPLVRRGGRWWLLDTERLSTLAALPRQGQLAAGEALALALARTPLLGDLPLLDDASAAVATQEVEVVAGGAVGRLVERLRDAADRPPAPATPDGFVGVLRPYQQRGVAWLAGMGDLGLGAVLADDMGLGKGIQLIAHVLDLRERGDGRRVLVICPTSVIGNWERELGRFGPQLPVHRHHGAERTEALADVDGVVLTTYGTLRRDIDLLDEVAWDLVVLDEAHHVKNPRTAGAKAVRRLRSARTVALTGTPLENRLDELWAVLDLVNPGLLGRRAVFAKRYGKPVERAGDRDAAARLRRLVAPFVLRREKRDPAVSGDLPPKEERTVVCGLTAEQAALYQAAVERALPPDGVKADSAMERRGRILALLTELKQICNHPAQRLGEDPLGADPDRSGKLATARELVAEAVRSGEQVLMFTQYVAMGRLLVAQLSTDLGVEVPFLHGAVPAAARDVLVADFQGESGPPASPVLVVSLRAGGTGLNLTAATQVIHYDRWWNPAVEDQATDRTHRIGQTRRVEVHKLVTAGTVEERVAELLERKRALADQVVGAGEAWITELGDADLRALVELSSAAVIDAEADDLDEVLSEVAP